MSTSNLARIVSDTKKTLSKHSPEILTGLGIAGMITTTILAVKATPKALRTIEDEKIQRSEDGADIDGEVYLEVEKLPPLDVVKVTWKCYIPAAVTGAISIACLVGASSVNATRNAALATAYKITETAFTDYKEKVVETIGEKKEQVVREKIDKDRIDKDPVSQKTIVITEKGNTLCYDAISGRYFKSDIELIKKAINEINRQMLSSEYISLNEFYDEIGLEHIPLGDELGWRVDHGYIDASFSSHLADDGTPCIVLGYSVAPEHGYFRFA